MMVTVRLFRKSDARATAHLIRRCWRDILHTCYSEECIIESHKRNTAARIAEKSREVKLFVACESGKVIGTGGFGEGRVRSLYVHPVYQRKKIASRLLHRIEQEARLLGLPGISVNSSLYAVPFYKYHGYRVKKKKVLMNGPPLEVRYMRKLFTNKS